MSQSKNNLTDGCEAGCFRHRGYGAQRQQQTRLTSVATRKLAVPPEGGEPTKTHNFFFNFFYLKDRKRHLIQAHKGEPDEQIDSECLSVSVILLSMLTFIHRY